MPFRKIIMDSNPLLDRLIRSQHADSKRHRLVRRHREIRVADIKRKIPVPEAQGSDPAKLAMEAEKQWLQGRMNRKRRKWTSLMHGCDVIWTAEIVGYRPSMPCPVCHGYPSGICLVCSAAAWDLSRQAMMLATVRDQILNSKKKDR